MTAPRTLQDLAQSLGATLEGDGSAVVSRCRGIADAQAGDLTFLANARYRDHVKSTKATAILIDQSSPCPDGLSALRCDDPYLAFRNAMIELHGWREHPEPMASTDGVSEKAAVHPTASVGDGTRVHPFAVIDEGAQVGRDCTIYPGAYIGVNARVGDGCLLFPNCVIYDGVQLGDRVTVHGGTVVGSDGFGYATAGGVHHKIPQQGTVRVESDVEFGGNCAIERAAMGETVVGEGTKFADLISIGHGTTIGAHCLLVSLVGVAGSVTMGNHVVLGGQVGIAGHLRIGDGVRALAQSGIAGDIESGQIVGGAPAIPADQAKRNFMAMASLSQLLKRVRKLEREADRRSAAAQDDER
ncbi:MAG: UDP-3-O-(3-hydroxymyristoyl)glucosamine N-acyltransferase [Phycisphaerales bacterium]|nr:UDP-3-O-(3-hydroxymyristoyl)glucosamine N-acyltransferase [Phycisphaerales bacterium]